MQRKFQVASLVITSTLILGGLAFGAPTQGTIFACLSSTAGTLTKVSTKAPTCSKGATLISWNQVGAQGKQGLQGMQGQQGIPGVTGATGAQGPKGQTGPSGDKGEQGAAGSQGLSGESSGYFIESSGTFYKVWLDSLYYNEGVKIDDVWWTITSKTAYSPYLEFAASDKSFVNGDVLVYDSTDCSGTAEGYLNNERSEIVWQGGFPVTRYYLSPTLNNVAVKIFWKYYSASRSKTSLNSIGSYFDGFNCVKHRPSSANNYIIFKLEEINYPSLKFDSPIELR